MQKAVRQKRLKEIIDSRRTADQNDLLQALCESGFDITQATISRDLAEMGYVKVRQEGGGYTYTTLDNSSAAALGRQLAMLFKNFVTDVCASDNLLIIKTTAGNANGVARIIDSSRKEGILGTIAGDDTILVVTADRHQRDRLKDEFRTLLGDAS